MAVAFGAHPHASERLEKLMAEASPLLQSAIFGRLAPWQKSLFPNFLEVAPSAPPSPAMEALADRLIREATR